MILKITGRDVPIKSDDERVRPENSEVERLCADNTKARRLLNWRPHHSLEDGLAKTIEWMKQNHDRYKPGHYTI